MGLKMETAVKKVRLLTLALNVSNQSSEFLLLLEVSSISNLLSNDNICFELVIYGIAISFLPFCS